MSLSETQTYKLEQQEKLARNSSAGVAPFPARISKGTKIRNIETPSQVARRRQARNSSAGVAPFPARISKGTKIKNIETPSQVARRRLLNRLRKKKTVELRLAAVNYLIEIVKNVNRSPKDDFDAIERYVAVSMEKVKPITTVLAEREIVSLVSKWKLND